MSSGSLLHRALRAALRKLEAVDFAPSGHFYSPVVDRAEAAASEARLWPALVRLDEGIELKDGFDLFLFVV